MDKVQGTKNLLGTVGPMVATRSQPARISPAPKDSGAGAPEVGNVQKAVEQLQEYAALHETNLNFSVHKATGRTVIRVIDAATNKVVREIPPEEILDLAVSLEKMAGTLLQTDA